MGTIEAQKGCREGLESAEKENSKEKNEANEKIRNLFVTYLKTPFVNRGTASVV